MPRSTFEDARQRLIDSLKPAAAAAPAAKARTKAGKPAKAAAATASGTRKKKA